MSKTHTSDTINEVYFQRLKREIRTLFLKNGHNEYRENVCAGWSIIPAEQGYAAYVFYASSITVSHLTGTWFARRESVLENYESLLIDEAFEVEYIDASTQKTQPFLRVRREQP